MSTNDIYFAGFCVLFVFSCFEHCKTLRDFGLSFFFELHYVVIARSSLTQEKKSASRWRYSNKIFIEFRVSKLLFLCFYQNKTVRFLSPAHKYC